MASHLGQHPGLIKEQLVALPPSPFSILHQSQQELYRSPSSTDEVSTPTVGLYTSGHAVHAIISQA